MAVNYSSVAEKIFRVLKGSGYDLKMYDNNEGSEVADPQQARFFYVQDPNLMVNLDDKNAEIKMHKGPTNIVQVQKTLDLLKNLSKTNLLDFDLREFGKEIKPKNYSFRLNTNTMSDNIQTEGLSAPIGTPKTSSQHLEGAKLLIKHRKPVNEEIPGSRSRNIKALYVENADGERFKYPFIHLNGARAMTRHVQAGGTPYDEVGQSITGMSEQLSKIREVLNVMRRSPAVQEQAGTVMSNLLARQDRLRETVKRLTTAEGYRTYAETYTVPVKKEFAQEVLNSMKEKFTVTNVDNRIEELLPFITEVNDEENTLEKLRDVVKSKMASAEFHEPTEKDVDTMPVQFTNDTMRVAARLALVAKLAKDDEISGYLSRMAAKIRGEDKEPAGGSDAVDKRPYTKDDIQVILKMLDDAKVKSIIQQVEAGKMKMMQNPGDDAYDKAVAGESVLPEIKQIDESFERMLGMFSPTHIQVSEKEGDPETDFTKWLKMNYNKTPRDLSADEYAKMSKEFKEQNKKTEAEVDEADVDEGNEFIDARRQAIKKGEKEFTVGGKTFKVTGDTSDEKEQNENTDDMFKKGGKYSQTAQNKPVMFKGKQIDLDSVEYDMQDYSDLIFELEAAKYMDGTDVADEDMADLNELEGLVDWVAQDYMDRMMDRADMMRDSKESELDIMKRNAGIQSEARMADMADIADHWPKISKMKMDLVDKGMEPEEAHEKASEHYGFDPMAVYDYIEMERSGREDESVKEAPGEEPTTGTGEKGLQKSLDKLYGPKESPKTIPVNKSIPLAMDSIWDKEGKNPKTVNVTKITITNPHAPGGYMDDEPDEGYRSVNVEHDGPWTIYTDSGFEKAISQMVGFEVSFTEQGMQEDGMASMEGDDPKKTEVKEGGNAFDIAMGDAENIISQASGDKEAMADLQRLHDDEDDSYAKSVIKDYMSQLEKEGLFRMQRDIAMQENKTPGRSHYDKEKAKELAKKDGKNPERLSYGELMDYIKKAQQMDPAHNQESVDPTIARIKDLAGI